MKVIAEGVETQVQSRLLYEIGCTIQQGYYHSIPLSEGEVAEELFGTEGRSVHPSQ